MGRNLHVRKSDGFGDPAAVSSRPVTPTRTRAGPVTWSGAPRAGVPKTSERSKIESDDVPAVEERDVRGSSKKKRKNSHAKTKTSDYHRRRRPGCTGAVIARGAATVAPRLPPQPSATRRHCCSRLRPSAVLPTTPPPSRRRIQKKNSRAHTHVMPHYYACVFVCVCVNLRRITAVASSHGFRGPRRTSRSLSLAPRRGRVAGRTEGAPRCRSRSSARTHAYNVQRTTSAARGYRIENPYPSVSHVLRIRPVVACSCCSAHRARAHTHFTLHYLFIFINTVTDDEIILILYSLPHDYK